MRKQIKATRTLNLLVDDREVPVNIYSERRRNSRVSIGKRGINIRLPLFLSRGDKIRQVRSFTQWAVDKLRQTPELYHTERIRYYEDGDLFSIYGRAYVLDIELRDIRVSRATVDGAKIYILLNEELDEDEQQSTIATLLSRCMAREHYDELNKRLHYLNRKYFNRRINQFRLKYTSSVWGSCSRKGNINLSTRLLFAPDEVIDYIMIHELAHLVQHNHSIRFWRVVEEAMPRYRKHVEWLRENGSQCDF